ncbi:MULTISPECIES: hypothetical protein [unclassified Mesorhizobium]|nr:MULTISPECIES: hypothetical protein [unclassified Mesorhizobium]
MAALADQATAQEARKAFRAAAVSRGGSATPTRGPACSRPVRNKCFKASLTNAIRAAWQTKSHQASLLCACK